jgi:hypothetical protein
VADCKQILSINCIEYFDSKFAELEKRLELRDKLSQQALNLAADNLEKHLNDLNNAKAELARLQVSFISKSEYEARHDSIMKDMSWLTKTVYIGMGVLLVIEIVWKYLKP